MPISSKFSVRHRFFYILAVAFIAFFWLRYIRRKYYTRYPSISHWAHLKDINLDLDLDTSRQVIIHQQFTHRDQILSWIQSPTFYTSNRSHYDSEYDHVLKPMHQFIDGKSMSQVVKKRQANQQRLIHLLQRSNLPQQIPNIVHYVWITSLQSPYLIPKEKLDIFFKQVDTFPDHFVQYFWFFGKRENRINIKQFEEYPGHTRLIIRDLREEHAIQYAVDLFDIYYEQRRYTYCSDIARLNLIYLYGGFYLDVGVQINLNHLTDLQLFTYVGFQEGYVYSTSFIGAKPRSWIFYGFLNMLDNLQRFKEPQLRNLTLKNGMVHWSALGGLTWSYDTFLLDSETYLPIDQSLKVVVPKHMATWVNGKLGQPSLKNNPLQPNDYFFTRLRIDNPRCYSKSNDLWTQDITKYMANTLGKTPEDIRTNRRYIEDTFLNTIYNDTFPMDIFRDPKIPRILHRCWLTTTGNEVRSDHLLDILHTYRLLERSYHDWTFLFWTNDPTQIPNTITFLRKYCSKTIIQKLNITRDIPYAADIFEAFFNDGRFANANDILRVNLIVTYGGVYMDIGVRLQYDLSALLIPFDNLLFFHDQVLDTTCFGAAQGDPLFQEWLNFLHHKKYKSFDRKLFDTPSKQMPLTGCHYLMTLLDIKYYTRAVLILQDHFFVHYSHLNSWSHLLERSKVDLWEI
jgi:hypothetical protein